jgi:short-subunit dehydrogenase
MSEGWRVQLAQRGIGVSVLCPGFVRTSIASGQRNRPGGQRPGGDQQGVFLSPFIDAGMDPEILAARVLEAIRDDELYIFTHPERKAMVEGRFNAILEAFDRAAKSPALKDHEPQDLSALTRPPPPQAQRR